MLRGLLLPPAVVVITQPQGAVFMKMIPKILTKVTGTVEIRTRVPGFAKRNAKRELLIGRR
jgi:hypothetical protein